MRAPVRPLLALLLLGGAAPAMSRGPALPAPSRPGLVAPEHIVANDNRSPGGTLRGDELSLHLEVRTGEWYPDGDHQPGLELQAFGEEGRPLSIPGPLLRVPEGTRVHVTVRNRLPGQTLVVHGLSPRGAEHPNAGDSIVVPAGALREVAFDAGAPGTYYYWGTTTGMPLNGPAARGVDSQLAGVFVIDPPGAPRLADRILVLGVWAAEPITVMSDTTSVAFRMTINGRSWPQTERLVYDAGDTVRWRLVNASFAPHPMHLHGFYFRVESRGDGTADAPVASSAPEQEVTERMVPGRTATISWVPDRPGFWLFHCHDNEHIRPPGPLPGSPAAPVAAVSAHGGSHALTAMAGLVMGVEVRPRGALKTAPEAVAPRRLRLVAQVDAGGTAREPAYAFSLEDPANRTSAPPSVPGPPIVLTRGQPVAITVVNRLPEHTAVHWHGIELDSYFDGVAGFAGHPGHIAPAIAPGDSFEARFTPRRAGTFIYHTHVDELRQQRAGLSGPLIVLEPGTRFDPRSDIVLFITTPRRNEDSDRVYLNGSTAPDTLRLSVGTHYRLRLVNVHTYRPALRVALKRDATLVSWHPRAKDGMDLPAERRTLRPALVPISQGETYDFELIPTEPGLLHVDVERPSGEVLASMPVRVE